jgi:hypothetical protein
MAEEEEEVAELESLYAIVQDEGVKNSGPACVAFLRFGGMPADGKGPPLEGEENVTRDHVRKLVDAMREEIKEKDAEKDASHADAHFRPDEVAAAVAEFAPVQTELAAGAETTFIYGGEVSGYWIETENKQLGEIVEDIMKRFDSLLSWDPRGLLVPMYSTTNLPTVAYQDPELRKNARPHWVVYLGGENGLAKIFDPDDRENAESYREMPSSQLAFAHYWYCCDQEGKEGYPLAKPRDGKTQVQGVSSYFAHGNKFSREKPKAWQPASPYILTGDKLGEVDTKGLFDWDNEQDLVALKDATYYYSYKTADLAAEALSESSSVVVIECPKGVFALVEVNDLTVELGSGEVIVDGSGPLTGSSEDSFFYKNWKDGLASVSLYLAYLKDGERTVRKKVYTDDSWPKSHREHY